MKRKRSSGIGISEPVNGAASPVLRKSARTRKTRDTAEDASQEDLQSSEDDEDGTIVLGVPSKQPSAQKSKGKGKALIKSQQATGRSSKERATIPHGQELDEDSGDDSEEDEVAGSSDELNEEDGIEETSKGARKGRPKGRRKRERTPTPPRTMPPHEHYFFQNRPGGQKTSNNTLSSVPLLSHEEYFDIMKDYKDPHQHRINFLHDLHSDSFDQWLFELAEGFNVCLYGWGSKRKVLMDFADHAAANNPQQKIVVLNGFMSGTTIRDLLDALASVIPGLKGTKIPANPPDAVNTILSALAEGAETTDRYFLLVHSLDAASLRRPPAQALLSRVASEKSVSLVATCDTPNFSVLWDASLGTQFNWAFHDATTFTSFDAEIGGTAAAIGDDEEMATAGSGVVDVVNNLLGRSGRKVHGREGVVFVLRSLTESARRLYGLLVAEVLSADEGMEGPDFDDAALNGEGDALQAVNETPSKQKGKAKVPAMAQGTTGVNLEYRALYRKAVQSLIATSEMQFRQLLKEFYDHEMLASKKDSMGTELLSLPFRRDELEAILDEVELE